MAEESTSDEAPKPSVIRRPRTRDDFYLFCTYVLQYENYETEDKEEARNVSNQSPPLDSSGSSVNSETTHSGHDDEKPSAEEDSDDNDSFQTVTCFCRKPFAGRPMIECSICYTWIHLSCARIKKSNIPDVFHCAMCKSNNKKPRSASPTNPPEKAVKRLKKAT
ncbi:PREDICTED: PHD finger protein 23-like isoform X2 [Nicrophorus vespilloides]|nr:PREDICTED: PHD finger protein 23-like isoform X2 [Nicrophorus vespilloides]